PCARSSALISNSARDPLSVVAVRRELKQASQSNRRPTGGALQPLAIRVDNRNRRTPATGLSCWLHDFRISGPNQARQVRSARRDRSWGYGYRLPRTRHVARARCSLEAPAPPLARERRGEAAFRERGAG